MRSSKPWLHIVYDTLLLAAGLLESVDHHLMGSGEIVAFAMPCHDHASFYARATPPKNQPEALP